MIKKTTSLGLYIACAMLVAMSLPVVVALTILNDTREQQISKEMTALVDEKSQTLAHSLVLPVWSLDQNDMLALLQASMLDTQVVSVEVRDPEERVLARKEEPLRRAGSLLTRTLPLTMQQPDRKLTLGSVQVVVSDAQLQRKLAAAQARCRQALPDTRAAGAGGGGAAHHRPLGLSPYPRAHQQADRRCRPH